MFNKLYSFSEVQTDIFDPSWMKIILSAFAVWNHMLLSSKCVAHEHIINENIYPFLRSELLFFHAGMCSRVFSLHFGEAYILSWVHYFLSLSLFLALCLFVCLSDVLPVSSIPQNYHIKPVYTSKKDEKCSLSWYKNRKKFPK